MMKLDCGRPKIKKRKPISRFKKLINFLDIDRICSESSKFSFTSYIHAKELYINT